MLFWCVICGGSGCGCEYLLTGGGEKVLLMLVVVVGDGDGDAVCCGTYCNGGGVYIVMRVVV